MRALLILMLLASAAIAQDQGIVVTETNLSVTGLKDQYGAEDTISMTVTVPRSNVIRARVEVAMMRDDAGGAPLYQALRDYDRYTTVQALKFSVDLPQAERHGQLALLVRVRGLRKDAASGKAKPFEEALTWRLGFEARAAKAVAATRLKGRVFFAFNSATLDAKGQQTAKGWAKALLKLKRLNEIRVEGHADQVGQPNYNLDLSRRRAEAIRDALIAAGVDGQQIRVVGFGFSRPEIKREADTEGVWENRRAEVVWFSEE